MAQQNIRISLEWSFNFNFLFAPYSSSLTLSSNMEYVWSFEMKWWFVSFATYEPRGQPDIKCLPEIMFTTILKALHLITLVLQEAVGFVQGVQFTKASGCWLIALAASSQKFAFGLVAIRKQLKGIIRCCDEWRLSKCLNTIPLTLSYKRFCHCPLSLPGLEIYAVHRELTVNHVLSYLCFLFPLPLCFRLNKPPSSSLFFQYSSFRI